MNRDELLSPREREVLAGIGDGMSHQQIADALGISHRTVAAHHEKIKEKLGAKKIAVLVKWAIKLNLTSEEP